MVLRFVAVVVCCLSAWVVQADEGMWMLGNLNKQTRRAMKELGLQMPADKLYSARRPSLKDAVVSFGGFCSGVVVSEDGLVFTNHHCGFSSVQQHSSVEHDYLKDGFVARNRSEELPNPELYAADGECNEAGAWCGKAGDDRAGAFRCGGFGDVCHQ